MQQINKFYVKYNKFYGEKKDVIEDLMQKSLTRNFWSKKIFSRLFYFTHTMKSFVECMQNRDKDRERERETDSTSSIENNLTGSGW